MAAKWKYDPEEKNLPPVMRINPELQIGDKSFAGGMTPEETAAAIIEAWDDDNPGGDDQTEEEKLLREIRLIGIQMGLFAHGEDFLEEVGAPERIIKEYRESMWDAIAQAAAKKLGLEDYKPLLLNTRTKEQEKAMAEVAAKGERDRLFCYLGTNYRLAAELMMLIMAEEIGAEYATIEDRPDWPDISDTVAFLVRYFFAIHGKLRAPGADEIEPAEKASLTDSQREELHDIIKKIVAYKRTYGGGYYESIAPCFHLPGMAAARAILSITQLPASEFFYEPTSKPYNRMNKIAAAGKDGQEVDVARKKPGASPVIVDACIHGENGETITIDGFEREIQAAIGNMIIKNNGVKPIVVTPDQIYREYAQLDSAATVTEQQRTEIIRVMDKLMKAQARLDFSAQLREHKHIEKQSDYDYEAEGAGRLSGAMIVARKTEAWWSGGNVGLAYIIYDYPLYFLQAHAVNQMAQIRGDLLRLMDKPESKTATSPGTQNRVRDVAIKRNILMRLSRMKKSKRVTRRIMISELIEDNIAEPVTPKVERTIREKTELLLQGLKEQEDGIKDYKLVKRGRKIMGFTVILRDK